MPAGHLVVIDVQNVFADAGSAWRVASFERILAPIDRLVDAFSPAVTFTRFVAPAAPTGAWRDYYGAYPFALVAPSDPMYALIDRYGGHGTEALTATTFSKWGPELSRRVGDAEPLVLCGVATECCVLSTAVAAADAGRAVRVVGEACAGADETVHAEALQLLSLFAPLVEVTTADEAVALAAVRGAGDDKVPG